MTLQQLAKLANVSVSTVSKAFHHASDVNEETRQRIFSLAKEYGCFGKYHKEAYGKNIVGIISHEFSGNYYDKHIEQLQSLIEKSGGIALISADHFSKTQQAELLDYYAFYLKANGIIVLDFSAAGKKNYELPIVSISTQASVTPAVDTVFIDLDHGMEEAAVHLRDLGHRHVAFLGETLTAGKQACFAKHARACGLSLAPEDIVVSPFRFEKAGEDGMARLLSAKTAGTAIVCAYDQIAFGAVRLLRERGYSVPEDFSIIGMDNTSTSGYLYKSLTTIDTHVRELCETAYSLLERKMCNAYYRARQSISISSELVVRESTAAPAGAAEPHGG